MVWRLRLGMIPVQRTYRSNTAGAFLCSSQCKHSYMPSAACYTVVARCDQIPQFYGSFLRSSTCQRLSCKSETGVYRCDVRPCKFGFPALQGTTPGLDWGCLLPVMREVQGFDQHGQHSRRGGEWCRGQARDQKVSKGLLRQHGILIGFSLNRHQKV